MNPTRETRRQKLQISTIGCEIVQPAVQKRTSGNILQGLKVSALTFLHWEVSAGPSGQHFISLNQGGGAALHSGVLHLGHPSRFPFFLANKDVLPRSKPKFKEQPRNCALPGQALKRSILFFYIFPAVSRGATVTWCVRGTPSARLRPAAPPLTWTSAA